MKEIDLESILNYRLATVAMLMKRVAYSVIADNGVDVTTEQWVILYFLWKKDSLLMSDLVKLSKKDFANVSRIVEKLIKIGYVKKEKNKNDARSVHISLLPDGNKVKEKVYKCWEEMSNIVSAGISDEEKDVFMSILLKIENNLIARGH